MYLRKARAYYLEPGWYSLCSEWAKDWSLRVSYPGTAQSFSFLQNVLKPSQVPIQCLHFFKGKVA
jgi:hypothetical protein